MTTPADPKRAKWLEAATTLSQDPTARVPCPNCGEDFLLVRDLPYEAEPTMFARYLRCPRCGSEEIIDRLRRK